MKVVALPRCGATRYCLDLQEETGLEFIGEVNPMYIYEYGDTAKKEYHETKFQPNYSIEKYIDVLINPDKYIALYNQSPHLMIASSDIVLLRKNMHDAFISQANFFIKSRPYLKGEGILQHIFISYQSFVGVIAYLTKHTKKIVWYEDYYNISGTSSEYIDSHIHGKTITKYIDSLFNEKITKLFEEVKYVNR